ncbi:MAG: radical SAM protein [Candidatus Micrarchaeia archaeon]|jgi:pyruvate formate lyase activating enzyme
MATQLYHSSILDGSTDYYPGKVCTVIFLGGCPLRCPWCYVPALMERRNTKPEDIQFFLDHYRTQAAAQAVCITGGEPFDQAAAVTDLCKFLSQDGAKVKVETCGYFPDALAKALPYVDYVALDVKAKLDSSQYSQMTGTKSNPLNLMMSVIRSMDVLKNSPDVFREVRTTIIPGFTDNPETIAAITKEASWADLYVLQQFRSDLEMNDPLFNAISPPSKDRLLELAQVAKKNVSEVAIRTTDEGEIKV